MRRLLSFLLTFILMLSSLVFANAASAKPSKVTDLKAAYVSTTSVKLKWTKAKNTSGYKVYKYISSSKKYVALKSTKSDSATVTGLKSGTTYKFAVRAYKKTGDKINYGKYSDKLKLKTLTLKKKDLSDLKNLLDSIAVINAYDDTVLKFDYKTISYKDFLGFIGGFPLYGGVFHPLYTTGTKFSNIQFYSYENGKDDRVKKADPKGTIAKKYDKEYGYLYDGYFKINADKFDWIIKNIYNQTPSHKKAVIQSADTWNDAYYYKGYYYLPMIIFGVTEGTSIRIISKKADSSGVYSFKIKGYYYEAGEETYSAASSVYKVTAQLKKIDGKRIWSLYTIK